VILDNLSRIFIYFDPRLSVYWDKITPCCVDYLPLSLGRYYLDFKCKYFYKKFDQSGIPIYKARIQKYHPTVICQYALGAYELLYHSNFQDKNLLMIYLNQADWLLKNSNDIGNAAGWKFHFDVNEYNLKKPWYSALTQGEAISVLLRAHVLSNKHEYLDKALSALNLFEISVIEGGILNYFNDTPIYEEYPSVKTNCALNGLIFGVFGLYDFILFNNNEKAVSLFNDGINSIKKLLPIFDTGFWTQYNLYESPELVLASCRYHLIHIEQLKALYYITGDLIFFQYEKKWEDYSSKLRYRLNALIKKIMNKK
jgi:hypothetical protein